MLLGFPPHPCSGYTDPELRAGNSTHGTTWSIAFNNNSAVLSMSSPPGAPPPRCPGTLVEFVDDGSLRRYLLIGDVSPYSRPNWNFVPVRGAANTFLIHAGGNLWLTPSSGSHSCQDTKVLVQLIYGQDISRLQHWILEPAVPAP